MQTIKFKQACIINGKFYHWHYWGYINGHAGHFVAPLPLNTGEESHPLVCLDKHGEEVYAGDKIKGWHNGTGEWIELLIDAEKCALCMNAINEEDIELIKD